MTATPGTITTTRRHESAHADRNVCPRCGASHRPPFPRLVARVLLVVLWIAILGLGACLALLIPLNLILVPCWLLLSTSIGTFAREVLAPGCKR